MLFNTICSKAHLIVNAASPALIGPVHAERSNTCSRDTLLGRLKQMLSNLQLKICANAKGT